MNLKIESIAQKCDRVTGYYSVCVFYVRFLFGSVLSRGGRRRERFNATTHLNLTQNVFNDRTLPSVSVCHALCESYTSSSSMCFLLLPHFLFSADANILPAARMMDVIANFFSLSFSSLICWFVISFLGEPKFIE